MLLKRFAPATAVALALILSAAAPARAQARPQQLSAATAERRPLTVPGAGADKPLGALFAESAANIGGRRLTEADFKGFAEWRQQQQDDPQPPAGEKMSKRMKVVIIVAIVATAALTAWTIANRVDNPRPLCADDPANLSCI